MIRSPRLIILLLSLFLLEGCVTQKKEQFLKIGTGSRIDILGPRIQFTPAELPAGWVVEGMDYPKVLGSQNRIANLQHVNVNGIYATHIQNSTKDFIVARYTKANLLVTPYLSWMWNVSEHKGQHHPVRLLVGFYGGVPQSPPLNNNAFIWRGEKLPPFDRLLAIGFDDMALKRGNLYNMGQVKYYVQRGGIEQTHMWYREAVDLSLIYQRAWPQDQLSNTMITFVGMGSISSAQGGGISFANIRLAR
ncbi:hypothetical protein [Terasakiella sp. SH-1]|uniref:hypothetical protein n=1 Tax=Terasakiella sp. SH-1 TaxID=2560057 RepID=UPI0010745F84|nr:hypothetical protein [Terasakiella sp. SH-1]